MAIQLFATCLIDSLFPETGEAVVQLLEKLGHSVEFPREQTCCGQPAFNAGYWDECRSMADHTMRVFEASAGSIVIPSGSCAAMIRHGYLELFADDADMLARALTLAERTYELSEFIVHQLGVSDIGASYPGRLAYHPSCHLTRLLRVEEPPRKLLSKLAGVDLHLLSADCCGFGGVFSVDHGGISAHMLEHRIRQIEAIRPDRVVACDVSCLMHLEGGLRKRGSEIRCTHLAPLLAGREAVLR